MIIQKRRFLNIDVNFVIRDYKYFLFAYFIAALFSLNFMNEFKFFAVFILLALYVFFVYRTNIKSRCACVECECEKLYFKFKNKNFALYMQLILSILILVFFSRCFVNEVIYFSNFLKISPAVIALIVTPFATELPECINSIIWLKERKDELALANILGAIVFQSTLLFAIGILLTPWIFEKLLAINIIFTIFTVILLLIILTKIRKINLASLFFCGIIYFLYLSMILLYR